MLNQLRGRNLAHVGCTLGLTLGLTLGVVAGLVISLLVRAPAALNLATLAFFGLTFGLGALGYYLGSRSSRRQASAGGDSGAISDTSVVPRRPPAR